MSESGIFKEAIDAINQGRRSHARDLLTRLLRYNKENPEYWLWLSSVVESEKEKIYCLQTILRIDPEHEAAKRGLRLIGLPQSHEEIIPIPPKRRSWKVDFTELGESPKGLKRIWANPIARLLFFSLMGIFVIGLVGLGIFGTRKGIFAPKLTITPLAWTDTPTLTPSEAPTSLLETATPSAPEPLWAQLDATYTPRPAFVNTPHPRSEAYRIGLRAYERGDYESMLSFMEQVQQNEPDAADVYYYLGEAYRLLGDEGAALQSYDAAIQLDEFFPAAYLGRALIQQTQNSNANIEADLLQAINLGPEFGDAYLELASYYLTVERADEALQVLESSAERLAEHPRFYSIRSRVYLALGQNEQALEDATRAYELDITDLSVYLLLAEAYFESDRPEAALPFIQTFGLYAAEDTRYWTLLGRVYYEIGDDFQAALDAFDQAIALDDENALAYQYRGLTALELGDGSQAVKDLYQAREFSPNTFAISLGFGRAMWLNGSIKDALTQMNASEKLAISDEDFAQLYYYRAQIAAELKELQRADLDWQALKDLPEGVVPEHWLQAADLYLNPPTATSTVTPSSSPTLTLTATRTPVPTLTVTPGD